LEKIYAGGGEYIANTTADCPHQSQCPTVTNNHQPRQRNHTLCHQHRSNH
jgi:ribosomal protein RSM22 (predicted rRNA methylase)